MPPKASVAESILDGNALIYKRPNSSVWQCRFKVEDEWVIRTTGQRDKKAAIDKVQEMYFVAKYQARDGQPIAVGKTFGTIAKKVIEELKPAAVGKSNETTIISQLTRLWIPQLGKKGISNISTDDLRTAIESLFKSAGRVLSARTVDDYNTSLMYVFNRAVELKAMKRGDVPALYKTGRDTEERPAFNSEEFKQLCKHLLTWVEKEGLSKRQEERRWTMLRLVYFIARTGVRPGTETDSMTWGGVKLFEKAGEKYGSFYVDGKTDARTLVADAAVVQLIEQLKERAEYEINDKTPVWLIPSGRTLSDPERLFKELLIEAKLLVDPITGRERTLYSLRHYYATQQLLAGLPMHTLARQMGTSVVMLERHYSKLTPMLAVEQIVPKP